jgi:type VI secretion system protein ImpK
VAGASLSRAAGDFTAKVLLFRAAPEERRPDAASLKRDLLAELEAFTRHPTAQALPREELEHARFALVAWADEMIMKCDWAGHDAWAQELLQLQLFNTNRGGNEFFERLERMRPEHNSAREIYYLCLAQGFEGQWAGHEAERQQILRQQFEMLRVAGRAVDLSATAPLSPAAYQVAIELPRGGGSGVRRILLGWAGAAFALFALYWIVLFWAASRMPAPPSP